MGFAESIARIRGFRALTSSWRDAARYRDLANGTASDPEPVAIGIAALNGAAMLCRPGTTDAQVLWDTFHEQDHLPPTAPHGEATIVDLGANVGYTMAHFASLYPQARIYGVELDAGNFAMARRNLAAFGDRVELLHAAVWNEDGVARYGGDEAWGLRVMAATDEADRDNTGDMTAATTTVNAFTLSSLFARWGIDSVDYLKMDIEGAEAQVLATHTDWAARVRSLKVEVHAPLTKAWCHDVLAEAGFETADFPGHAMCVIGIRP